MTFAGVDVGAESVKVVVLRDSEILFSKTTVTEEEGEVASQQAMEEALKELNLSCNDLSYVVSTGVGRSTVGFANMQRSEQLCHARGGLWLFPSARTVLDAGAGGSRAMRLNEEGRAVDFATNSKCAAGTGAFLEAVTRLMEMPVEKMAELAASTKNKVRVSSYCAVFAESEVISHIHRGAPVASIAAGIHEAVVDRLIEILNRVGVRQDVVFSGGVAKNKGIVRALEQRLGFGVKLPEEPLVIGALGAALIAKESFSG